MNRFCLDTPLPGNDRSCPPFYSSLERENDKGALLGLGLAAGFQGFYGPNGVFWEDISRKDT